MATDTDPSLIEAQRRRAELTRRQNRAEDTGGRLGEMGARYTTRAVGMAGEMGARAVTRGTGEVASTGAAALAGLPTAGIASPFVKAGGSLASAAAEQGVGLTARVGRKTAEMAAEKVGKELGRRAAGAAYRGVSGRERAQVAALEAEAGSASRDPLLTDSSRLVYTGAKVAAKVTITATTTLLSLILSPLMMILVPLALVLGGFILASLYFSIFI